MQHVKLQKGSLPAHINGPCQLLVIKIKHKIGFLKNDFCFKSPITKLDHSRLVVTMDS